MKLDILGTAWTLVKESVVVFMDDDALTRGAAIAFYTVTSIGPVLFIVVAIAGLFFGEDAARGAIAEQLGGLMGRQSADLLQTVIQNAATETTGFVATAIGVVALVITASGVFTEMQATLNIIWMAEPRGTTMALRLRVSPPWHGVVMDNLSTHSPGALYEAFPAPEAHRVLRRLEFHYTPKHASWLNMVEIEIGVLRSQCLARRIGEQKQLVSQITAREKHCNATRARIKWMFTVDRARTKLARAYPHTTKES